MMKILIVDDRDAILDSLRCIIEFTLEGTEIITAKRSDDAIAVIENSGGGIDVLITDLALGYEAEAGPRILKLAKCQNPKIKSILYSGNMGDKIEVNTAQFVSQKDDGENSLTPLRNEQMQTRKTRGLDGVISQILGKYGEFDLILDKSIAGREFKDIIEEFIGKDKGREL